MDTNDFSILRSFYARCANYTLQNYVLKNRVNLQSLLCSCGGKVPSVPNGICKCIWLFCLKARPHYSQLKYSFFGKKAGRRHNDTERDNIEKDAEGFLLAWTRDWEDLCQKKSGDCVLPSLLFRESVTFIVVNISCSNDSSSSISNCSSTSNIISISISMTLGLTQPLTEMSTRCISWG